jgi:hypothetical protein
VSDDVPPAGPTAIERAFAAVYPEPPERRAVRPAAGAPADSATVVRGIDAHRGDGHWHLVTRGLTDGPTGEAGDGRIGHELTLLVPAADRAPEWAFGLLLGAARTAAAVGRPFHAGARLAPGAPVDGADSGLVALGVRADPLVAVPDDGDGVLQLVGITAGEYLLMQRVGTALVLERLAARDPLLRTDPDRA